MLVLIKLHYITKKGKNKVCIIFLFVNNLFGKITLFYIPLAHCSCIAAVQPVTFLLLYMDFFAKIMYHNMIDKYVINLNTKLYFKGVNRL